MLGQVSMEGQGGVWEASRRWMKRFFSTRYVSLLCMRTADIQTGKLPHNIFLITLSFQRESYEPCCPACDGRPQSPTLVLPWTSSCSPAHPPQDARPARADEGRRALQDRSSSQIVAQTSCQNETVTKGQMHSMQQGETRRSRSSSQF